MRTPADLSLVEPAQRHPTAVAATDAAASGTPFTDRLITAGTWLAIVGALVQGLVHAVNAATFASPHLDANAEHNIFSLASSNATLAVAVAASLAMLAGVQKHRLLLALVACATYLSLDDALSLHETITLGLLDVIGIAGYWGSIVWPTLYLPLLLTTAVLLVRLSEGAPARGRLAVLRGLALLGFAVVLEVASTPVSSDQNLAHTIEGGFEESFELAGWILIAAGCATIAAPVRQLTAAAGLSRS